MKTVAVIGIGSPFGTDQFAWQVIEYLKTRSELPNSITLVCADRVGTNLLAYLQGADGVILIDAVEGGTAGRQVHLQREQLETSSAAISSHQLGVADSLALGKILNSLPPYLVLLGVEIGEPASANMPTEEAIKDTAASVVREINRWREKEELLPDYAIY